MREVRRFIQRIRSDICRYRIRLYLYDTAKIRSIIVVTICAVIACLYIYIQRWTGAFRRNSVYTGSHCSWVLRYSRVLTACDEGDSGV